MIGARRRRRPLGGWQATFTSLLLCLVALFAGGGKGVGGASLAPELTTLRTQLIDRLAKAGLGGQVELAEDRGDLVIRLSSNLLYESGQTRIRPQAIPVLDQIGILLGETDLPVAVEGHTDSDPMLPNPTFPDNWALSAARATGVLRYLLEFHALAPARLTTAGYADTRPVASNGTAQGKAQNRRVEIRVMANRP